ncbi:MAG: hypothetical protein HY903_02490 [Deltaproteobacteria bacterium]|nr:hypothetical protein [Deltaproteobacteria bacterium]
MPILTTLSLLLGFGPDLDPLAGAEVSAEERALLPSGGHAASVADLWFLEVANLRTGGGALATFEAPALAAHGWSWTDMRFSVNGHDVTDPARSGVPLVEVPHSLWSRTHLQTLATDRPRWDWQLALGAAAPEAGARLASGRSVGGPTLIPEGLMDREPALRWGATPERRSLLFGTDVEATASVPGYRVAVEERRARQGYPTLVDDSGAPLYEDARRTTVLIGGERLGLLPLRWLLMSAQTRRTHAGAEHRYPAADTLSTTASALVATVDAQPYRDPRLRIDVGGGLTWGDEHRATSRQAPYVEDLEGQWERLARLELPGSSRRYALEGRAALRLGAGERWTVSAAARRTGVWARSVIPGLRTGMTLAAADASGVRGLWMDEYQTPGGVHETTGHLRLEAATKQALAGFSVEGVAAVDSARVVADAGARLQQLSPALGLTLRRRVGAASFFLLLRREPLAPTTEVSAFLDRDRPSYARYAWQDDGDLVPEADEHGRLLAVGGGDRHELDPDLVRPMSHQLAIGAASPRFGPMRIVGAGLLHVFRNRYTVRLVGPAKDSYRATTLGEAAGADPALPAEDRGLTVYARTPGTEGLERYQLTNSDRTDRFLGAELCLTSEGERWWFVNLAATGYWSLAAAPFGLYADANDPGILDAGSADPNHQVNGYGSVDAGRAYHIKLISGLRLDDLLSAALVLRYTDGEPMTRIAVARELPQGPTAVMAVPRGDPIPRFTFHMTLDVRVRYVQPLYHGALAIVLDVYNLLGSGTEILERTRSAAYRRSLEMMPGRAVSLAVELMPAPG